MYIYIYDDIPIYLYLLTPATYLPNYTEWSTRSDKRFTYRTARWIYRSTVYDIDILESRPSRAELSRAVDFAPISGSRRNDSQIVGIAERVAFSLPLTRPRCYVRRVHGNSCSLHSARNARGAKAYCRHVRSAPLRCLFRFFGVSRLATPGVNPEWSRCHRKELYIYLWNESIHDVNIASLPLNDL